MKLIEINSSLSRIITETFSISSARFVKNSTKYKRASDGSYTWAWTGKQVVARLNSEQEQFFKRSILPHAPAHFSDDEIYPLYINGILVGHVWLWVPYAYDSCILYLELVPEMQYDTRVVRRFARLGRYTKEIDLSQFVIAREELCVASDSVF